MPASKSNSQTPNRNTKNNKKVHNVSGTLIAGIFFIAVLGYMLNSLLGFFNRTKIPSFVIQYGSIDLQNVSSGIIIRDETVYKAPKEGIVEYNINSNERVKLGSLVCSIQDADAVSQIKSSMEQVDNDIIELRQRRAEISSFSADVQAQETKIKTLVDSNICKYIDGSNIADIYKLKESVDQNIRQRNNILLLEGRGNDKTLTEKRSQYLNQLDSASAGIIAKESGILHDKVDGLEQVLTLSVMENLTKDQTLMKVNYDTINSKRSVKADEDVFKIISSNDWYIASYIPNNQIIDWIEGDIRTIYIERKDDYYPLSVTVQLLKRGESESYALFKSSKYLLDFIDDRSIKLKTRDSVKRGLKIPNSAIVDKTLLKIPIKYLSDNGTNTYIIKRGIANEIIPVALADKDPDFIYVTQDYENIRLGDIIINPLDSADTFELSDVINVKGVYSLNNGLAEFCRIVVDAEIPENYGYSILYPEYNKNVMVYDRIVSDARSVEEGSDIF